MVSVTCWREERSHLVPRKPRKRRRGNAAEEAGKGAYGKRRGQISCGEAGPEKGRDGGGGGMARKRIVAELAWWDFNSGWVLK